LVIVNSPDDPIPAATKLFDVNNIVPNEKRLGLKNIHIADPPHPPSPPTCYLASEVFGYFGKPEAKELEFLLDNFMQGYMQETDERKLVVGLYEKIVPNLRKKLSQDPRRHEIFEIADRLVTKGYESARAGDYEKTYQLYIRALLYSLVYYLCPDYVKIKDSRLEFDLAKLESDLNSLLK
jgi:hypothetical protein